MICEICGKASGPVSMGKCPGHGGQDEFEVDRSEHEFTPEEKRDKRLRIMAYQMKKLNEEKIERATS